MGRLATRNRRWSERGAQIASRIRTVIVHRVGRCVADVNQKSATPDHCLLPKASSSQRRATCERESYVQWNPLAISYPPLK